MTTTAIKERPILFSGPMVRAILDGTKTQTRRAVKPQPVGFKGVEIQLPNSHLPTCPYGQPGDRLWVREAWQEFEVPGKQWVRYKAEHENWSEPGVFGSYKWRSPIHMPRWASRITLEVTEVRVQRVQEISEEDAVAEGLYRVGWSRLGGVPLYAANPKADPEKHYQGEGNDGTYDFAPLCFADLWDSINGKKTGHAWADNPFVWAVTFKTLAR